MFKLKYFEMFAGIGGFRVGIEQATEKWECIGYSEIDKYASAIYEYRYPGDRNFGDATNINVSELPDFDLLVGGFPASLSVLLAKKKGLMTQEVHYFLKLQGFSSTSDPDIFYSKMLRVYLVMTMEKLSQEYLGFLPTLGMSINGKFLIADAFQFLNQEKEFSFLDILEKDVNKKYSLSQKEIKMIENKEAFTGEIISVEL